MKIAFFALKQAIYYFQIGGTESFVRRLSSKLVEHGCEVDYILYGDKEDKNDKEEINLIPKTAINSKYFNSFKDAFKQINQKYDHVITTYVMPKNRIKFALFRKKDKGTTFHFIYFSWPDSLLKRKLYFLEARLLPYNGKLFCISKRQYQYVKKWSKNAIYLLPPVPEKYFFRPEEKPVCKKLRVNFLGRIDPRKGIKQVKEIFMAIKDNDKFECGIYGIHMPECRESLEIHNELKEQKEIKYIEIDRQKYSPGIEDFVGNVLKETDIFIQPYQKLSSTIDTPLLFLEAIASLCVVITKPFGNIPDIYGESKFLIHPHNFVKDTIELLKDISFDDLVKERERIYQINSVLNFSTGKVAKRFINALVG